MKSFITFTSFTYQKVSPLIGVCRTIGTVGNGSANHMAGSRVAKTRTLAMDKTRSAAAAPVTGFTSPYFISRASKVTSAVTSTAGGASNDDEFVEDVVCREEDIGENQMKQLELGEGKVLLVRQRGKLTAIGSKCSHYNAQLVTGALGDGRVRCPWHGACFNVETGDIEDFPGMDSLPCYRVTVTERGEVRVRARRSELATNKRTQPMVRRNAAIDDRTFVVIGAGPSGATCAETLRQEGFAGRVVMINKEPYLPYDRVKVSKTMDMTAEKCLLRPQTFYDANDIEVILGTAVSKVDGTGKELTLDNGYKIKYDKAYIATGSNPRRPPIEGANLRNVCVLVSADNAKEVHSQLTPEKRVVILGTSFIGLEAAAYCTGKVARVTVVGRGAVPLKESFGESIGRRVMEMFREKGVEFILNSGIKRCIADEAGAVKQVELADGSVLEADICIFGIGSTLYTEFLEGSGIPLNRNGSVETNQYLETALEGVYAGGDIANAPVVSNDGQPATIGHYPLAQFHGRVAAFNMVGKVTPLQAVPFFWTVLFGKSFRYSGYGTPAEVIIDGDLEALKFVAFYIGKTGRVVGMASCQRDPIVAQFAEYSSQGKVLHKSDLETDRFAWISEITGPAKKD
ncbi:apoptosis-inducing factor 3-like isoform X1 [Anopheles bellator]|uniref:apoptosis-inducing factor 3-like isoform X1 n=1 Tax=Anopheles bellator TaxID=139047 RepID=UPI002647833F|nr:apoptosis-inducing factor 3-like isoform X1 [Anopheles bellator]